MVEIPWYAILCSTPLYFFTSPKLQRHPHRHPDGRREDYPFLLNLFGQRHQIHLDNRCVPAALEVSKNRKRLQFRNSRGRRLNLLGVLDPQYCRSIIAHKLARAWNNFPDTSALSILVTWLFPFITTPDLPTRSATLVILPALVSLYAVPLPNSHTIEPYSAVLTMVGHQASSCLTIWRIAIDARAGSTVYQVYRCYMLAWCYARFSLGHLDDI